MIFLFKKKKTFFLTTNPTLKAIHMKKKNLNLNKHKQNTGKILLYVNTPTDVAPR